MTNNAPPRELLDALYADGLAHDAEQPDRTRRRRNLEPEAAELLWITLRASRTRRMVEIGTSNGYSTIWFAAAMRATGGTLTSVDIDPVGSATARENLERARLDPLVELVIADGGNYLGALPTGSMDALFLDSERTEYASWWPHPWRVLRPGGLLLVDNVLSHPDEVAELTDLIEHQDGLDSTVAGVGKGVLIALAS